MVYAYISVIDNEYRDNEDYDCTHYADQVPFREDPNQNTHADQSQ